MRTRITKHISFPRFPHGLRSYITIFRLIRVELPWGNAQTQYLGHFIEYYCYVYFFVAETDKL